MRIPTRGSTVRSRRSSTLGMRKQRLSRRGYEDLRESTIQERTSPREALEPFFSRRVARDPRFSREVEEHDRCAGRASRAEPQA